MMSTALIVPVKNGGPRWHRVVASIQEQTLRPQRVVVIDSGSTDGSDAVAKTAGFELYAIAPTCFDHGGTRQMAVEMVPECEIVIFLTQDAVLEGPDTLEQLVSALRTYPQAGVAYGRQLPRAEADPIERHARLFNYPERAAEKSLKDIQRLGIKTAFTSNSFAASRGRRFCALAAFPKTSPWGKT